MSTCSEPLAIEIRGLSVDYEGAHALHGIDLEVPRGSAVALLGANGAGKTTTIRAITGMLHHHGGSISSGSISIAGVDRTGQKPHVIAKARVAHVPEGRMVFPGLSVHENLQTGLAARTTSGIAATFEAVFSLFPVLAKRRDSAAGVLSGGEQQMLAIARALMADPTIMVLDEVSLGLAPLITASIFESLDAVRRELGTSMLIVEQNARRALKHTDRACVIEGGRVVNEGSSLELREGSQIGDLYLGGASRSTEAGSTHR